MTLERNKFRVRVDWDNDGFIHEGVPTGLPSNLIRYSVYSNALLFYQSENTTITPILSTYNPDQYGLTEVTMLGTTGTPFTANVTSRSFGIRPTGTDTLSLWEYTDTAYVLQPNTDYTLIFYIKNTNALDVKFYRANLGLSTETLISTTAIGASPSAFQKVVINIADTSTASGWFVTLSNTGTVKGIQLYEGTVDTVFHASDLAGYDDISQYVLSASWELGRNKFDDPLAYEGTARIILNNESRIFSPANTNSPLYGKLRQNLLIKLEYEVSINNWQTVWAGWTQQFKTQVGLNRTLQAEIICGQGIYKLRDGVLDAELSETITVNDAIYQIIQNCGFRSAYYPLIANLNLDYYLNWNAFVQDVDNLFSVVSPATRNISGIGLNWGRKTSPSEALESILEAEHSKLWLDREGGFVLQHREDFINPVADYTISLDTSVQDAVYNYGEDTLNRVEVIVKPRKETSNEIVWSTKEAINIAGHPFGDGNFKLYTRYIDMQFEFEEGTQRTLTAIDGGSIKDMTVQVYNRDPSLYADPSPYLVAASDWDGEVHATVLGFENLRKKLQVRNNLEYPVWIHIQITGSYVEGSEGGVYVVEDEAAQRLQNSVQSETVELSSATTESEAISFGEFLINRKALPQGEFSEMTVYDDVTYKIGDILSLSESQTGESGNPHVILAESGDYAAGTLIKIVYKMARLDRQVYFAVGDETAYGMPNPIENMLDAVVPSVGTWEKISVITPEGDEAYLMTDKAAQGKLIIGDMTSPYHFLNGFQSRVDYLASPQVIVFNDVYDKLFSGQSANSFFNKGWHYGSDKKVEEFYGSKIAVVHACAAGTYFVDYRLLIETAGTYAFRFRRISDDVSVAATADNVAAPFELAHTDPTDAYGQFDYSASGVSYFGDLTMLHYETLPTDALDLEAGVQHYIQLWAAHETVSGNIRCIVIAEDGTKILDTTTAVVSGFHRYDFAFTPVSGKEHAHGIILDFPNTRVYVYGIGVSPILYDTYKEMNAKSIELPVLFI